MGKKHTIAEVQAYWDSHLNLTQFLTDEDATVGSDEFWQELERSMDRYGYKRGLLERFARETGGGRLLEVGSGLGLELAALARLGFSVTGIDLSLTAVSLCNEYLGRQGVPGSALVQNAEEMAFSDERFDAVYSSGVIQHTPDIERAIAEIRRILRRQGSVLVILYHRYSWFHLLHLLTGVNVEFESHDAPIVNSYTRAELRSLFSAFSDVRIATEYYRPKRTRRRGVLPFLYNYGFVPAMSALPEAWIRRFGWHLVLTARK